MPGIGEKLAAVLPYEHRAHEGAERRGHRRIVTRPSRTATAPGMNHLGPCVHRRPVIQRCHQGGDRERIAGEHPDERELDRGTRPKTPALWVDDQPVRQPPSARQVNERVERASAHGSAEPSCFEVAQRISAERSPGSCRKHVEPEAGASAHRAASMSAC